MIHKKFKKNSFLRYYRSGSELYRMAIVYMNEGNHENAYILFLRFLTLFVEKIPKHPKFKEVPANTKKENKQKMTEIMSFTEKLKVKLLDRYAKEYEQFLIDQEEQRKKAIEEAKKIKEKPKVPTVPSQPSPRYFGIYFELFLNFFGF